MDLVVILMFMEMSGLLAVWGTIEYIKAREKNTPKSRVKSKNV